MIKFSLESATNLRDLIRRLSVGLGKLVSTVTELDTFVGFRGEWDYDAHGSSDGFTADVFDERENCSYLFSNVIYDPQNAYNSTAGAYKIPSDGYYQILAQVSIYGIYSRDDACLLCEKNEQVITRFNTSQGYDVTSFRQNDICVQGISTFYAEKNDILVLKVYCMSDSTYSLKPYYFDAEGVGKYSGAYWEIRKIGR